MVKSYNYSFFNYFVNQLECILKYVFQCCFIDLVSVTEEDHTWTTWCNGSTSMMRWTFITEPQRRHPGDQHHILLNVYLLCYHVIHPFNSSRCVLYSAPFHRHFSTSFAPSIALNLRFTYMHRPTMLSLKQIIVRMRLYKGSKLCYDPKL